MHIALHRRVFLGLLTGLVCLGVACGPSQPPVTLDFNTKPKMPAPAGSKAGVVKPGS